MAWLPPPTTSVGQTLTAALWNTYIRDNSNWDHNLGTLAYVPMTTSQTGIVGGGISALTATVTVVAGRRIKISVYCESFGSGTGADAWTAYIKEGVTQLQTVNVPAGRLVKISGYISSYVAVGDHPDPAVDAFDVYITDGDQQLQMAAVVNPGRGPTVNISWIGSPTAGTHTYRLRSARRGGTQTGTIDASPSSSGHLLVEDISPAEPMLAPASN